MYEAETRGVWVRVTPEFLDDESSPERDRFVWSYTIEIENQGDTTVRLTDRYWRIMDANGKVTEVRGEGVVGEQPVLRPGEAFRYTSGAPLATPSGIMSGQYRMETSGGDSFEAEIPAFSLDSPHDGSSRRLN